MFSLLLPSRYFFRGWDLRSYSELVAAILRSPTLVTFSVETFDEYSQLFFLSGEKHSLVTFSVEAFDAYLLKHIIDEYLVVAKCSCFLSGTKNITSFR